MSKPTEIQAQIAELLAKPLPPPAEKHLVRERLVELYMQLHPEADVWEARRFAVKQVPQNVFSYPMHHRETVMPTVENYRELYAQRGVLMGRLRKINALAIKNGEGAVVELRAELAKAEFERLSAMEPDVARDEIFARAEAFSKQATGF